MEHISKALPARKRTTPAIRDTESPIEYGCPICKDAGFVYPVVAGKPDYSQTVVCECRREEVRRDRYGRMLKFCSLPSGKAYCAFANFDAHNASLKSALKMAQEFAAGKDDLRWLTMFSKVDTGKSHLAVAICKEWIKRGIPARYIFVPDLLDQLRRGYEKNGEDSYDSLMTFFLNVPLLVLDDLGTQKATTWAREKLTQIINHRHEYGLHLVVTMNCTLDEIPGDDEGRIASRLQRESWCRVLWLEAPEYSLYKRGIGNGRS